MPFKRIAIFVHRWLGVALCLFFLLWVTRWLYHGLHSLDCPWLYNHRPAWDIVVVTFMLGGTAISVTSLVLAWRVLGRTLTRSLGGGATSDDVLRSDDLVTSIEP